MSSHDHHPTHDLTSQLGALRGKLVGVSLLVALVGILAALAQALLTAGSYRRFMLAYLVAFAFVLSLSLGAFFFVFIQHLTRAGWSVLVRRLAEAMTANLGLTVILFIPIALSVLMGKGEIYPWAVWDTAVADHAAHASALPQVHSASDSRSTAHAEAPAPHTADKTPSTGNHDDHAAHAATAYPHQQLDSLTLKKRALLNPAGFVIRWVLLLSLWAGIGWWFWKASVGQDQSHDPAITRKMETLAGPIALLFGVTLTLGAVDLLMSLNPHWYSTMFGVYYFSGAVVGALATLILLVRGLKKAGVLTQAIGMEHQHDMGKLLFAFVFFWGYIAFSQYMLLWYANMPETTGWLRQRGATTVPADQNAWTYVILALLLGHFVLPFAGLMSRHVKRRVSLLALWAIWMLAMHYLDLLWIVMPELGPNLALGAIEIGLALGLTGLFAAGLFHRLGKANLVPTGDPRLGESVAFENI